MQIHCEPQYMGVLWRGTHNILCQTRFKEFGHQTPKKTVFTTISVHPISSLTLSFYVSKKHY